MQGSTVKRPWMMVAAWLLLLVATLVMGRLALRLLATEQEQVAEAAVRATETRARNIAESMNLAIYDVKQGLLNTLSDMNDADPVPDLIQWKLRHPLIRNIFVWRADHGLVVPNPDHMASDEEERFARQFNPLFTGTASWDSPAPDHVVQTPDDSEYVRRSYVSRQKLRQLATAPATAIEVEPTQTDQASGWIPWFSDNELSLLGWRSDAGNNKRFGFEVELMALVSRLLDSLPKDPPDGHVYTLRDGLGHIVYQTGPGLVEDPTPVTAAVFLGSHLPHWSVAVYQTGTSFTEPAQNSFRLLSLLLVGGVLSSILLGGSLLLWQAYRCWQDARRKTSFVSNVSHELKTPLTTIRMYAELLGEGRVQDEQKKRNYLDVIVSESQRLTRLVNNVLDFSHLEQKRKTYVLETIDLAHITQDVLDTQRMRLVSADIQLDVQVPMQPCSVKVDRDAVEQVLLNLTDNAIKYAGTGKELTCTLTCDASHCVLTMKDRGPGISAGQRKRIFDKFHRVDDSLTAKKPGSGLGLSIARQLVQDLGGDLTCSDRQGGGTSFTMRLPKTKEAEL